MKSFYLYSIIIFLLIQIISSQVVCSEDELVRELLEDLADNGRLDCLRHSVATKEETEEAKRLRIAAEWNGDCSFESNGEHWVNKLIKNYKLEKGLIDAKGNKVEGNLSDQADMCEIVRSLIGNGKFPNIKDDVTNIDSSIVDYINCPGGEGQTRVCAATGKSFANKDECYILLDGKSITANEEPKYKVLP